MRRPLTALLLAACSSASEPAAHDDGGSGRDAAAVDPSSRADAGTGPGPTEDAHAPDASEPCVARDTDQAPRADAFPAKLAGQDAWIHDDKSAAGWFHTFDALKVPADAPARKVHVLLPRGYGAGDCKRYPVLYFNDGDTTFWPGGAVNKTWSVQSALADLYARRAIGEVIVVAVVPIERDREYTHTAWLAGRSCCGLAEYASWLARSLKPFVDGAYRTKPAAAGTVVVGSSHGGLAAFYAAALHPEAFGAVIAMSPSFWAGLDDRTTGATGGPLTGSALMGAVGDGLRRGKPRVYLDWGLIRTGGVHNAIIEARATDRSKEMAALLTQSYGYTAGRDLATVEDPLGEHDEPSWGRRIGGAIERTLGR